MSICNSSLELFVKQPDTSHRNFSVVSAKQKLLAILNRPLLSTRFDYGEL